MQKLLGAVVATLIAAGSAHAVTYTTSTSIAHDPNAATSNFVAPGTTTNAAPYTIRTAIDANYFYVDAATTAPGASGDFANIYVGGLKFTNALVFEVTNDRVSSTGAPGTYYSLANTGFTYTSTGTDASGYDISFALPLAFLVNNPDHIDFTSSPLVVGDQVRVSGSQSYGYSYVGGESNFGSNRLGSQNIPAPSAVPEPAAWALMLTGFGAMGGVLRRRRVGLTATV